MTEFAHMHIIHMAPLQLLLQQKKKGAANKQNGKTIKTPFSPSNLKSDLLCTPQVSCSNSYDIIDVCVRNLCSCSLDYRLY